VIFNTQKNIFASATKVCVLCYLLTGSICDCDVNVIIENYT